MSIAVVLCLAFAGVALLLVALSLIDEALKRDRRRARASGRARAMLVSSLRCPRCGGDDISEEVYDHAFSFTGLSCHDCGESTVWDQLQPPETWRPHPGAFPPTQSQIYQELRRRGF